MSRIASELKIVGDVFPDPIDPCVNLELNFENTQWLGAHGHSIPPNWALYSPKVTITTNDDRERFFTLLMMDIGMPFYSSINRSA